MTDNHKKQLDWQLSQYAQPFFRLEQTVLEPALRQAIGPSTLQIGSLIEQQAIDELDLPLLFRCESSSNPATQQYACADLFSDAAFLPFSPESFSTVVLPHVLEGHTLPHQVLREAHRVLMPEGYIVLTGFNPMSLVGLQHKLSPAITFAGRYYTPRRVVDWLQLLGFEIVANTMFQYAPLSRNEKLRKSMQFLETVGDRWLPMFGGGYMINAKKKDHGMTFVGKVQFAKASKKRSKLSAASAKAGLRKTSNKSN